MKTASQIEKDVFLAAKTALKISGTVYREGYRPDDANSEDAVVTFVAGLDDQVQSGKLNVNVYVTDQNQSGRAVKAGKRIEEIEQMVEPLLTLLQSTCPEYDFSKSSTPKAFPAEGINQHFLNIPIKYKLKTFE